MEIKPIAHMVSDFPTKFGIPRQSGLADQLTGRIVFEEEFADPSALKGLEGYSHIWLIWGFSENLEAGWTPMVRPPRLGGNEKKGVFATRSPFRPNGLGLSCVELLDIADAPGGKQLVVGGADLMDGTPIYDVKPYIPHADLRPEATGGWSQSVVDYALQVEADGAMLAHFTPAQQNALCQVLSQDPRPAYQEDPGRIYGMPFAGYDVRFRVADGVLYVVEVVPLAK